MKFTIIRSSDDVGKQFSLSTKPEIKKKEVNRAAKPVAQVFDGFESTDSIADSFEAVEVGDGKPRLVKEDDGLLVAGDVETVDMDVTQLEAFVRDDATTRDILVQGTCNHAAATLTTRARRKELRRSSAPVVCRTKEDFTYSNYAEGFLFFDYDPPAGGKVLKRTELIKLLYGVVPEIKDAPLLWKTSSGSNIRNKVTGKTLMGIRGQHIFIAVKRVDDVKRVAEIIYKRLWMAGHGYIYVDQTGGLRDRSVIDRVVNSPERAIFLKSTCKAPLEQTVLTFKANELNPAMTTASIKDLLVKEEQKFEKMLMAARKTMRGVAEQRRDEYLDKWAGTLGVKRASLASSLESFTLFEDFKLIMADGEEVTVGHVLRNKKAYDNKYCADPFEPDYGGVSGGRTKAWLDLSSSNQNRIFSHAHGGINYILVYNKKKTPPELANSICHIKDHTLLFAEAAKGAHDLSYLDTEIDELRDELTRLISGRPASVKRAFDQAYDRYARTCAPEDALSGSEQPRPALSQYSDYNGARQNAQFGDLSLPLNNTVFPNTRTTRNGEEYRLATIENLQVLLGAYGVKCEYEEVLKKETITFPRKFKVGQDHSVLAKAAHYQHIVGLIAKNGLAEKSINHLGAIMHENTTNHVLDWVRKIKWDGVDRVTDVINNYIDSTVDFEDDAIGFDDAFNSVAYKNKVLRNWFVQCVAALDGARSSPHPLAVPKYEYVLVFVGKQGVRKTSFIDSLLPRSMNEYIGTGVNLKTGDRDSLKIATSAWITELGELDSTFRSSDIAQLKAFLSNTTDRMRMPYARTEEEYPRRTVFCASVNDRNFLVDKTGNRRYLPLTIKRLTPFGGSIDHQQFWSQVWEMYLSGEIWWCDEELEDMLSVVESGYRRDSTMAVRISELFDLRINSKFIKRHKLRGMKGTFFTEKKKSLHVAGQPHTERHTYRFVVLGAREIIEMAQHKTDSNMHLSELRALMFTNGIDYKSHKVIGGQDKVKKGYKLALKKGVSAMRAVEEW